MHKPLERLVEQELSRKDFLKFIGGGLIALVGLSNLISYLTRYTRATTPTKPAESNHGFGSRKFGG